MKKNPKRRWKTALGLTPLTLGFLGFAWVEKAAIPDALFTSTQLYMMKFSGSPPNVLIEIARWTAPMVTASGLILMVRKLYEGVVDRMRYLRGDSVAVYGDPDCRQGLLKQLGKRGIEGRDDFLEAGRYILVRPE